jgi:hypothetical protein
VKRPDAPSEEATETNTAAAPALQAAVCGLAFCRLARSDIPQMRKRPAPVPEGWEPVAPSLLRYSDEQTIAGLCAVFRAVQGMGQEMRGAAAQFERWGVVAAPRYQGRASVAHTLRRYSEEGVWSISPHLIPHFALHSPAGTISQALGIHGPNVGAGGGPNSAVEGFLAALTWLSMRAVPGVWLVMSGWTPELIPERLGSSAEESECLALALALVPAEVAPNALRVQLDSHDEGSSAVIDDWESLVSNLEELREPADGQVIACDASQRLVVKLVDAQRPRRARHVSRPGSSRAYHAGSFAGGRS